MKPRWVCSKCGFREYLVKYYWRCPRCGSSLDIDYPRLVWAPHGEGMARYSRMLPIEIHESLGEGGTPLVYREYCGLKIGFKLEYLNPSGSFKDRGTVLALSLAKKLGYKRVVEDTSGNTGISIALYSRAYGLSSTIVVPKTSHSGKLSLLEMLGANIVYTRDRGEAARLVLEIVGREEDYYYVAHTWSPLYPIAYKTIAYELYEQGFREGVVVAPIGSGGLYLGLYRGFRDLYELGFIEDIPLLVGVQGASIQHIYRLVYGRVVEGDSSLADGLMVENPPRLEEIVGVVRKYGDVVVVSNEEIVDALKWLLSKGFIVEPTSATALAGLWKLLEEKKDLVRGTVYIPLTGSGLKVVKENTALMRVRH